MDPGLRLEVCEYLLDVGGTPQTLSAGSIVPIRSPWTSRQWLGETLEVRQEQLQWCPRGIAAPSHPPGSRPSLCSGTGPPQITPQRPVLTPAPKHWNRNGPVQSPRPDASQGLFRALIMARAPRSHGTPGLGGVPGAREITGATRAPHWEETGGLATRGMLRVAGDHGPLVPIPPAGWPGPCSPDSLPPGPRPESAAVGLWDFRATAGHRGHYSIR